MGFGAAVGSAFGKYVTFSGRAARAEFWWFVLFAWLVGIGASLLDAAFFGPVVSYDQDGAAITANAGPIGGLWSLATFLPSIAVSVRRLHDFGRSGWWWWLWLVPVVGWIVLLIWFASRGTPGVNRFGADPLAAFGASPGAADAAPRSADDAAAAAIERS